MKTKPDCAKTYTVSCYILDRLHQLGVRELFEVPGDYASIFLETLEQYPAIREIPNINELGVGYASDGYARFRGIAACSVQYGVGSFSILNCIAGSLVERVPVALIAPSPSSKDRQYTHTRGILYHHSTGDLEADAEVMEHATVDSVIIYDAEDAPRLIDEALTRMLTFSRPVYIEVLQDVFGDECAQPQGQLSAECPVSDPASLEAMLDAAWAMIEKAKLPVLWLGVEIQRFGLQELMQQIVEASGMHFTTTSLGKTVLDEGQKPFIGTYAGPASRALTRAVMAETDCVIALGTVITDDYLDIMGAGEADLNKFGQMIEVNDEKARIGEAYYQDVELRDFLEGLLERFEASKAFPRRYRLPAFAPDAKIRPKSPESLSYTRFYHVMADWLIRGGNLEGSKLILGESTSLYVFGNLMGMSRDSFVAQAAWGSLGHETGCALGVELATGDRPIVVAGDGGFMMICQEISSLVRQNSNAVIFVMSNGGYAIEQAFVDINAFTPKGSFTNFDLLPEWDYVALAKAFGAKGYVVETVRQLRRLLRRVETRTGVPTLVQVKIDLKDLAPQLERLATTP